MSDSSQSNPAATEYTSEIAGEVSASLFWDLYGGNPPSRELARTESFCVWVDVSPLVRGHLLVVPVLYSPSWAALSQRVWAEWSVLRARLVESYEARWGEPIIIEHGSTDEALGAACITHAHLHLLPAQIDFRAEMLKDGVELRSVEDQRSLAAYGRPYFYIERADGDAAFAWADEPVMPTQYLRRLAARQLGYPDPEWDWAVTIRKDLLRATVAEGAGLL